MFTSFTSSSCSQKSSDRFQRARAERVSPISLFLSFVENHQSRLRGSIRRRRLSEKESTVSRVFSPKRHKKDPKKNEENLTIFTLTTYE